MLEQVQYACFDNVYTGKLKPRNIHQELAFDMLKDRDVTVKLITGTWGTGKTLSLVVAALEAVQKGYFEKIIWIRNNVQVKDTDKMGALPGDEYEKLLPYLGPLMDHVGGEDGAKMLISGRKLDVIPLAFLRGRSIKNAIIISSEAENLTKEHLQLLLGRVDEGSNLWLDADLKQRDKAVFEKSAGIETMIERLKGEPLFGYVHLVRSERSATARLADKLND
jgi:PhoH-like ATPase